MITIYKHEIKSNLRNLLIWAICVGGMGLACILMFHSMQGDMESMAENFASMGAFSDAFGMSQLSIATLIGFYATEVGTIHSLGGAMFAAIVGTSMLSKEEDGHTSEFLLTLPISRAKVVLAKWSATLTNLLFFNLLCVAGYLIGFAALREEIPAQEYALYHLMLLLMQIELATLCYAFSAFLKKNRLGLGLGIVLLFYAYDLMARVIPDLKDYKILSPFSYANAADILSTGGICLQAVFLGTGILILSLGIAFWRYARKDLAA